MDKQVQLIEHQINNLALAEPHDTKHRKYVAAIDKSLTNFEACVEWADYISFLTRLLKALDLGHNSHMIPKSVAISNCLSRCLSFQLPSGVHKKTLEVYTKVFDILGPDNFNAQLHLWLKGLLPLMSYVSINVKPSLVALFNTRILHFATKDSLSSVTMPLLSSLLPGIDDESAECFDDVMGLIATIRNKGESEPQFWRCFCLNLLHCPDRRLGALVYCQKQFPDFSEPEFKSESALIVRAFAASLQDDNILVQRGFFDILIAKLRLNSSFWTHSCHKDDTELIVMAACSAVLKKDMSLNRRLWSWLLGTDDPLATPIMDSAASANTNNNTQSRTSYFSEYGEKYLTAGFLKLINSKAHSDRIKGYRLSLAFMDKWEIGTLITTKVFLPFLRSLDLTAEKSSDIVSSAGAFFDTIESNLIFKTFAHLLHEDCDKNLPLIHFVLTNFNVSEVDMLTLHWPLIFALLLAQHARSKVSQTALFYRTLLVLLDTMPDYVFTPDFESEQVSTLKTYFCDEKDFNEFLDPLYDIILKLYTDDDKITFSQSELSFNVYAVFTHVLCQSLQQGKDFYTVSELYVMLLEKYSASNTALHSFFNSKLVNLIYSSTTTTSKEQQWTRESLLSQVSEKSTKSLPLDFMVVFGTCALYPKIIKTIDSAQQRLEFTRIVTELLFSVLSTNQYTLEAQHALETVELSTEKTHVQSCAMAIFAEIYKRDEFDSLLQILKNLESSNCTFSEEICFKVVLYELLGENRANYVKVCDWLNVTGKSEQVPFNIVTMVETDSDDYSRFRHNLRVLLAVTKINVHIFSVENTLADYGDGISYGDEIIRFLCNFLQTSPSEAWFLEQEDFHDCSVLCVQILANLDLDVEISRQLVEIVLKKVGIPGETSCVSQLLDLIGRLMSKAHHSNKSLSLVEVSDNGILYIEFLLECLTKTEDPVVIAHWCRLLSENLVLLSQCVFDILVRFVGKVCEKIKDLAFKKKANSGFSGMYGVFELLHCLEDLLLYSHMFLAATEAKPRLKHFKPDSEQGFLTTVMSGVFSVEPSDSRQQDGDSERLSVLTAFSVVTAMCFELWSTADKQTDFRTFQMTSMKVKEQNLVLKDTETCERAALKMKAEAKRVLEKLYSKEQMQILHVLLHQSLDSGILKLVHVLDNSRPQTTLASVFSTVHLKATHRGTRRSSMIQQIPETKVLKFLCKYLGTMDSGSIEDVYTDCMTFLKDVSGSPGLYKSVWHCILQFLAVFVGKLSTSKFGESRKVKREASDTVLRVLSSTSRRPSSVAATDTDTPVAAGEKTDPDESSKQEADVEHLEPIAQEQLLTGLTPLLESLNSSLLEPEKCASAAQNILYLVNGFKEIGDKPSFVAFLVAASENDKLKTSKPWRHMLTELFNDSKFFDTLKENQWHKIIHNWLSEDHDKVLDIVQKISSANSNPTTLFTWNESETQSKILRLKRVSYVLLSAPQSFYVNELKEIMARLCSIDITARSGLETQIFVCLRVVVLKFDASHLMDLWNDISSLLETFFTRFLATLIYCNSDEKTDINSVADANGVLMACKLLDVLLYLKFEDFSMSEWLFVGENGLIDKIAKVKSYKNPASDDVKIVMKLNGKPFLHGYHKAQKLEHLKPFFASLRDSNIGRVFSKEAVDHEACLADVQKDLF